MENSKKKSSKSIEEWKEEIEKSDGVYKVKHRTKEVIKYDQDTETYSRYNKEQTWTEKKRSYE
jgi:hypothetical protein